MLTSIDFQFLFDSACLSASSWDKGLFSSPNFLQIAEAVRRVVFLQFLFFLANSSPNSSCETSEIIRRFVFTAKTTQPRPQIFSIDRSII